MMEEDQMLHQGAEVFRQAFINSPLLMAISDIENGRLIEINDSFVISTGFSRSECLGQNGVELGIIAQTDYTRLQQIFVRDGEIRDIELQLVRKDGSKFQARFTGKAIDVGNERCLFTCAEDVTDQYSTKQALAESREQYRNLYENALVGLFQTRRSDGLLLKANAEMARILGFRSTEEAVRNGAKISDFYSAEDRARLLKKLGEQQRVTGYELELTLPGGRSLVVEISAQQYPDKGFLEGVMVDITHRKQVEQELRSYISLLEYREQIATIIRQSTGMECLLEKTVAAIKRIFKVDRAWLVFPCNPAAGALRIRAAKANADYRQGIEFSQVMGKTVALQQCCRAALKEHGPLCHGPGNEARVSPVLAEHLQIQSMMNMALRPRLGDPWLLSLHQCSEPRQWTTLERSLLLEIGNQLNDSISSMLIQADLQASEMRFKSLVANLPGVVYRCVADEEWTMLFTSESVKELSGYPASDFYLGRIRSFTSIIHPDDRLHVEEVISSAIKRGEVYTLEYRVVNSRGETRWVWERGQPAEDATESCGVLDGVIIDITDQRQAERELHRLNQELTARIQQQAREIVERHRTEAELKLNQRRLQSLLKMSQLRDLTTHELVDHVLEEAIRLTGSEAGYIAFLNSSEEVLTMHSWSRVAMQDCSVDDVPVEFNVSDAGLWGEPVRQRRPVITNDYSAENPLKRGCPEGHVEIKRHMSVPVFDEGRIVAVAGVGNKTAEYDNSDIMQLTLLMEGMYQVIHRRQADQELRESQTLLLQSEKLAAIGEMASGIAHELNQPLNHISITVQLLERIIHKEQVVPADILDELGVIRGSIKRAVSVIRSISSFSRSETSAAVPIDVRRSITGAIQMFGAQLSVHGIKTEIDLPEEPVTALGSENYLGQVIVNLIVNARDALDGCTDKREKRIRISAGEVGGAVVITVSDNGTGIETGNLVSIFNPFFTTKEPGAGTGLGLSISHRIVESFGGTLTAESEVGVGTTMTVRLRIESDVASDQQEQG